MLLSKPNISNYKILFTFICLLLFSLPLAEVIKQLSTGMIIILGVYSLFKYKLSIEKNFIFYSFLALVMSFIVTSLLSPNTLESLNNSKYLFRLFLIYTVLSIFFYSFSDIKKILYSSFIGYVLSLLWAYYDFIQADYNRMFLKLHSVGHINHSSIFMLYIFILIFSYLIFHLNDKSRIINFFLYTLLVITIFTIFLTGSRATMYTALGIMSISLFYFIFILNNYKLLYVIVPLLTIIYFAIDLNTLTHSKFLRGFEDSARLNLLLSGIKAWYSSGNILFGLGVGNYNFNNHSHAHNTYINLLVENGLVGLFSYLLFIFSLFFTLIKKFCKEKENYIVFAAILLWISNFIISFANTTFHHENAVLLTIIWIIALNINNSDNKKNL